MGFESSGNNNDTREKTQEPDLNINLSPLNKSQNSIELNSLIEKQNLENESQKEQIKSETNELLNKEALINEAKTIIYEKLGINDKQNLNSNFENFTKGFVDEMVLGNYEMAVEIINTRGKVIIEALKSMATYEGLKQMAKALGESIWDLFVGNSYEKGKSVAALGLITTGVGLSVNIGKKGLKLGMKRLARLRINKENIVSSPRVKNIISQTRRKLDEIVPKKQFDFEGMVIEDIAKLGDKDRIDAGRYYLQKKLNSNQENAIIKAHNVGKNREGAGIGNYNMGEIREKHKILKEAGFDSKEIRILMEKGICGKLSNLFGRRKKPKASNRTDILESKGTYELSKIKGLKIVEANKRIEKFASSIDIDYLINNPQRINDMLDIVEDMCNYMNINAKNILSSNNLLYDFRRNFSILRKNIGNLLTSKKLKEIYKDNILETYNENIVNTFYKLNPNLVPKK